MVAEYMERCYEPLAACFHALRDGDQSRLRDVAADHQRVRKGFAEVGFVAVELSDLREVKVMDTIEARVTLALGSLHPDDIRVELVRGSALRDDPRLRKRTTAPPRNPTR